MTFQIWGWLSSFHISKLLSALENCFACACDVLWYIYLVLEVDLEEHLGLLGLVGPRGADEQALAAVLAALLRHDRQHAALLLHLIHPSHRSQAQWPSTGSTSRIPAPELW